jgi:hypothetical protein
VSKSRRRGAIPPFPNAPSWRGAQLKIKHRDNFTFIFTFTLLCRGKESMGKERSGEEIEDGKKEGM